ncbi:MAG: hypothetical protein ACFFAH_01265 [Promethearchaeota archaeon]
MPSNKVIEDIWILSEAGTVIFHRVFDEKVDPQLFGGLMTALNTFAEEISKRGLSNFEMGDKRFTILKRNTFLFIANSDIKIKQKKVIQELNNIIEKFFNRYPKEVLDYWNYDVSLFFPFKSEIENSLVEPIKKFQKAFW